MARQIRSSRRLQRAKNSAGTRIDGARNGPAAARFFSLFNLLLFFNPVCLTCDCRAYVAQKVESELCAYGERRAVERRVFGGFAVRIERFANSFGVECSALFYREKSFRV